MILTSALALLFDSQAEKASYMYGDVYAQLFLEALSLSDPQGETHSRILRGDAMPHFLCTRVKAVANSGNTQSFTQGHDIELYKTIMWDLADAFSGQWNTLDLEDLPLNLHHGRTYCLVLPTAPLVLGAKMDSALRGKRGYLGAVQIDVGNPLQTRLFFDVLISDIFLRNGSIWLEEGYEGSDDSTFEGAADLKPGGMRRLPTVEFYDQMPPLPVMAALSDRGRISAERINGKSVYSIEERVLAELAQLSSRGLPDFAFESTGSHNLLEADLPAAKFIKYLLNPEHKEGSGKAKFFREVLGIQSEDWRYLADQFYQGIRSKKVADLKIKTWEDGFGASFNCVLSIKGLNGRVANVFTNWIMKPGTIPQLSTARPAEESDDDPASPASSNIVPATLEGDERWKELYRLADEAGMLAAQECVPTPMKVEGYSVIMEGMCGSASVRIRDARKGFARWLLQSKTGSNHYQGGAIVSMYWPTQSYDRSRAYVKEFAAVLALNGIASTIKEQLD